MQDSTTTSTQIGLHQLQQDDNEIDPKHINDAVQSAMNIIKSGLDNNASLSTMDALLNEKGIDSNDIEIAYANIYTEKYKLTAPTNIYKVDDVQLNDNAVPFTSFTNKQMHCFKNAYLMQNVVTPSADQVLKDESFWRDHIFVRVDRISYKTKRSADQNSEYLWKMKAYESLDKGTFFVTLNPESTKVIPAKYKHMFNVFRKMSKGIMLFMTVTFNLMFLDELRQSNHFTLAVIGLSFMLFGLLLCSAYIVYQRLTVKTMLESRLYFIPIVNVALFRTSLDPFHETASIILDWTLLLLMTFPLYLINLSYLLSSTTDYKAIPPIVWIQLVNSIFSACWTIVSGLATFSERYSYFDKGLILSFSDKLKIKAILAITFVPVIIVEVTQFFPFLFYFYVEIKDVDHYAQRKAEGLFYIVVIFLVSKSLFVMDMFHHICVMKDTKMSQKIALALVACLLFMVGPMVPYIFMLVDKKESKKCKFEKRKNIFADGFCSPISKCYFILSAYLILAYGISCVYIVLNRGHAHISLAIQVTMACVLGLVLLVIVSFPKLYYMTLHFTFKGLDRYEAFAQQDARGDGVAHGFYNLNKAASINTFYS
eukprot:108869_1